MYEKFFNLQKAPFGMTPDPSALLMTDSHREALSGLLYAVLQHKGFVVLTGDAGTGKTTLLRALIRSSKSARFSVILNPTLNLKEFLELVLLDFGINEVPESKAQRIMKLQEFLVKLHEEGSSPVLIVDEAHKLNVDVLEEIRLLTNFETADKKLLQIVLAGQTELSALLNRDDMRQLKQRIEVRLDIKPLSAPDVEVYLRHRWERAGGTSLPFSPEAIAMITTASRGIPRLVNSICDNALLLAYGAQEPLIAGERVRQVLRDLDLGGFVEPAVKRRIAPPAGFNGRPRTPAASPREVFALRPLPTIQRFELPPPKPGFIRRLLSRLSFNTPQTVRTNHE